ncbi:MAG: SPOR domain-containing protein, partial [Alphaproteobacteria bacterium]
LDVAPQLPAAPPPPPRAPEPEQDSGTKRRRFPFVWLVVVLVLAGVGYGGWKGYQVLQGTPAASTEILLFTADTVAFKTEPDDPGGMEVDNQGTLILEETLSGEEAGDFEVLLPEPEEPLSVEFDTGDGVIDVEAAPVISEPIYTADEVTTLVDEVLAEANAPPVIPIPGFKPEPPAEGPPDVTELASVESIDVVTPEAGTGMSFDDVAASLGSDNGASAGVPEPEVSDGPVEEVTSVAALPETGGVARVQIAAYSSREAADTAWVRLYRNHTDLLSNQEALIMEAVISGTSFFRLQVGAYDTKAGADALCASLKQRDVDCLVVGP